MTRPAKQMQMESKNNALWIWIQVDNGYLNTVFTIFVFFFRHSTSSRTSRRIFSMRIEPLALSKSTSLHFSR